MLLSCKNTLLLMKLIDHWAVFYFHFIDVALIWLLWIILADFVSALVHKMLLFAIAIIDKTNITEFIQSIPHRNTQVINTENNNWKLKG